MPDYTSMHRSYVSAFRAYHKVSTDHENGLACHIPHIPTTLEKLQLDKGKPTFNILSIGAGDGLIDQEILKIVQEGYLSADDKCVKILNTAIEPNSEFLRRYKESIERRCEQVKGKVSVKFDLKAMTFEEYVGHAIHSLYHMDMESTLKHCYYNKLGQKGLFLCRIGNASDLVTRASQILDKHRPECQRKPRGNPAAKLVRIAEKNSMMYERVIVPYSVDVASVFDENSLEGRHLLDFIVHENNYRQTADKEELADVLQMLRDISFEDDHGRLLAKVKNELIFHISFMK